MCTNILLKPASDIVISARTMDFGNSFTTSLYKVNRNTEHPIINEATEEFESDENLHLSFKNEYGYLSAEANLPYLDIHIPVILDGMNEKGLSAAALWLACTKYPKFSSKKPNINSLTFPKYILGKCKSVEDIESELNNLNVWGFEKIDPTHYIFTDKEGKSIVVEFESREIKTYIIDNGVLTNDPFYHKQLEQLKKYKNLSFHNKEITCCDGKPKQETNGSGLLGLPGDSTPISRFVKATEFAKIQFSPKDQQDAISVAANVIGSFCVPFGTILKKDNSKVADYTKWNVIREHNGYGEINYYFRTKGNTTIYKVELNNLDWNAREKSEIKFEQPIWFKNKTSDFKLDQK